MGVGGTWRKPFSHLKNLLLSTQTKVLQLQPIVWRDRPFTEMVSVAAEDDEANANALLVLTRTLEAETAATVRQISEFYKLQIQSRMQ